MDIEVPLIDISLQEEKSESSTPKKTRRKSVSINSAQKYVYYLSFNNIIRLKRSLEEDTEMSTEEPQTKQSKKQKQSTEEIPNTIKDLRQKIEVTGARMQDLIKKAPKSNTKSYWVKQYKKHVLKQDNSDE